MSVWAPPRLLELAGMNLLREEASAFSGLEDPPTELFSPLFMEVFEARCIETLKAMVLAWPFVHLPLGNLIDMPHVGPLQAELEALDILFAQKLCPRLPGPDAQVRVHQWPSTSEHNTRMSPKLPPLLLYPEWWYPTAIPNKWVYKFQFLAFACAEKGFTAKSKVPVLEGVVHTVNKTLVLTIP
ncbi:hypothetical protein J1605_014165 [Eschrichtius robustus]|uniref:Uncharacterized protein n=1 Tax=Eschrichtius robustus TaxID=9764 RepID=A0AB34GCQ9_ESCRO|nr:hypothetical protein J1605_014165 [Eschrichtius robustus]